MGIAQNIGTPFTNTRDFPVAQAYGKPETRRLPYDDYGLIGHGAKVRDLLRRGRGNQSCRSSSNCAITFRIPALPWCTRRPRMCSSRTSFGSSKNLSAKHVLAPWLRAVTSISAADAGWAISFWEKQARPIGVREGNTNVDLVLDSDRALVFVEVKLDAPASAGTAHDPDRNQLVRNLDIGFRRATEAGKQFALIFVTPSSDGGRPGSNPATALCQPPITPYGPAPR